MGQDKAALRFQGKPLIQHAIDLVSHFTADMRIVGPPERYELKTPGVPVMADLVESRGPISGILTALLSTPSSLNLIVACDMPRIPITFVDMLFEKVNQADAAAFKSNSGLIEPLCALYTKNCLPFIDRNFRLKRYQIADSLEQVRVNYISEGELLQKGLHTSIFRSINTRRDFAELLGEDSS